MRYHVESTAEEDVQVDIGEHKRPQSSMIKHSPDHIIRRDGLDKSKTKEIGRDRCG